MSAAPCSVYAASHMLDCRKSLYTLAKRKQTKGNNSPLGPNGKYVYKLQCTQAKLSSCKLQAKTSDPALKYVETCASRKSCSHRLGNDYTTAKPQRTQSVHFLVLHAHPGVPRSEVEAVVGEQAISVDVSHSQVHSQPAPACVEASS